MRSRTAVDDGGGGPPGGHCRVYVRASLKIIYSASECVPFVS